MGVSNLLSGYVQGRFGEGLPLIFLVTWTIWDHWGVQDFARANIALWFGIFGDTWFFSCLEIPESILTQWGKSIHQLINYRLVFIIISYNQRCRTVLSWLQKILRNGVVLFQSRKCIRHTRKPLGGLRIYIIYCAFSDCVPKQPASGWPICGEWMLELMSTCQNSEIPEILPTEAGVIFIPQNGHISGMYQPNTQLILKLRSLLAWLLWALNHHPNRKKYRTSHIALATQRLFPARRCRRSPPDAFCPGCSAAEHCPGQNGTHFGPRTTPRTTHGASLQCLQ